MIMLLSSLALAGSVYVNGVNVDALRNQTFEDVTVFIDAQGNVRVDAPQYEIEVVDQGGGAPPPANNGTPVKPAVSPPSTTESGAPLPGSTGVPAGSWWLVTEDNGSGGHSVSVYLNGVLARQVKSGEPQLIEDITGWLKPGSNQVRMVSNSQSAVGGTLYVYLGTGNNDSGTVVMDPPKVQFGVGQSRSGEYERTYSIQATP